MMDVFRPLWHGGGRGGEHLYILFSVDATLSGSGAQTKDKMFVLKHTHAYRLHIDHLVSLMYVFFIFCLFVCSVYNVGAGPQRADTAVSDKPPKISESSYSHSRWVFDGQQQNIAKCVSSALKGRFRCTASSWDQQQSGVVVMKHKENGLKLPQQPASNHSVHRFLSVFTAGHLSNGVGLLVGPSPSRWEMTFSEAVVLSGQRDTHTLIWLLTIK